MTDDEIKRMIEEKSEGSMHGRESPIGCCIVAVLVVMFWLLFIDAMLQWLM